MKLSILLKKDLPLTKLLEEYSNEDISEALRFIEFEIKDTIEIEEDFEMKNNYGNNKNTN